MKNILWFIFLFLCDHLQAQEKQQSISKVWVADNGNGTYKNPVINADYSDPDAIRVGDDYYMIASSFTHIPGLPILHSKDLVNWQLIGHALKKNLPLDYYEKVQHGAGVWAPSIRYHNNEYYIYYPDPDFGIYLIKSKSINGPWSEPVMVEAGKGLIDPCPLWDDNGKVYLAHAYAGSRAGIKSIIVVKELSSEGDKVTGNAVMVYDGHENDATIEGPKFYKRKGYYYIFAPAGGVSTGWQTILRSKNVYGPYERKIAMNQGASSVNGPHQGAWITTKTGEDWFLHFQDKEAYGRVVHLQPMKWVNDWPEIGIEKDGDGIGEPVMVYKKPNVGKKFAIVTPPDADEFNSTQLGLQWQWQANPKEGWAFPTANGSLRLFSVYTNDSLSTWNFPNILAQKLPTDEFSATTKFTFSPRHDNERFGFIIFGADYAYISLQKRNDGVYITFNKCLNADKGKTETEETISKISARTFYFKITVLKNTPAKFSYSNDGKTFTTIEREFTLKPGRWVGAKIGFFSTGTNVTNDAGFTDVDWIRLNSQN